MGKENTTCYIILGLLTHKDMSGYDIKKMIDTSISNFWDAGYGQIYPTLKTLEKDGFVIKKSDSNSKGPDKFVYSITGEGKDELVKWLSLPGEKEYVKYEMLLKLFFGKFLEPEENIKRIDNYKKNIQKRVELLELWKEKKLDTINTNDDHFYYYLTILFGEHIYKACVEWADKAEALIEDREKMIKVDNH